MSIQNHIDTGRNQLTIHVSNRFDFHVTRAFRNAYRDQVLPSGRYIVDLGQTDYMDSAALGMLLILREQVGGDATSIRIINCQDDIKNILRISKFEQYFEIE